MFFYLLIHNNCNLEEKFYNINDDLLVKHLLGESDPGEMRAVQQWLDADPSNKAYYDGLREVWENSKKLASTSAADENRAWDRFRQRIHSSETAASEKVITLKPLSWFRVAATILLVIGLSIAGIWVVTRPAPVQEQLVDSGESVQKDTLPDNSIVTLNKQSSISYPSRFSGDTRTVKLKGEAFFNVTADKKKPFIINVDDVTITVVGTSFNVKSVNGQTEVAVETGIVRVTKNGKSYELRAKEKLNLPAMDSVSEAEKEEVPDKLYQYYRTGLFVCDETPLWKLVQVLNEAYNVNIVIVNDKIRNLPTSGTYKFEEIETLLQLIEETHKDFGVHVTQKGVGNFILE